MKIKHLFAVVFLSFTLGLTACRQLDVIGNKSITSFEEVLQAIPESVSADETYGGWVITAPDGSARYIWSKDFSTSKEYDVLIEVDAKPFIDAGLDIAKLPEKNVAGDKIIVGANFGDESISYDAEATPIASYEKIVQLKRDYIGYHNALDHFGIDLTEGNAFEWAKDISKNDKDIVFVLDPKVFVDAGTDQNKIEGWIFAKVEKMDENGKMIKVNSDKLIYCKIC